MNNKNNNDIEKALFVLNNAKVFLVSSLPNHTGGKFLCSLLDSHKDLFAMPCSIHAILPPTEKKLPSIETLFSRMRDDHVYFQIYNQLKENNCLHKIKLVTERLGSSLKIYVLSIIYFYHISKNINPKKNIFVIHTHDIKKTEVYLRRIENAKLIH